jgi:hypothetical protein
VCEQAGARLVPATLAQIAATYRERTPLPTAVRLALDERGRAGWVHLKGGEIANGG